MIDLRNNPRLVYSFAMVAGFLAMPSSKAAPNEQNIADLIGKMEAAADRQRSSLCGYSVIRHYTLQNKHLTPSARMEVRLIYKRGEGKHFQTLSIEAKGVARRSLEDLLKNELKTGEGQEDNNATNTSHYRFTLLGEENYDNRHCYKVQLNPLHKSKYLIDGTAWISTDDYAIVRIVGRLAKSPSFWLSRPEVEQRFEKIDGFWMPSYNHSTTHVLFFGEADLTVEYSGYRLEACKGGTAVGHLH